MKLWVGTTNKGKLSEFAAILSPLGVELIPIALDVPETGDTFEDNARQKAIAYAFETGELTVSEDSGLCISALNGLPGPWSARFSDCILEDNKVTSVNLSNLSREVIDTANNQRVLDCLQGIKQPNRAASFKVRLVLARGNEILYEDGAETHGWIAEEAKGNLGFGYDPIFIGQDTFGATYAELDPVRKNLRSHRKRVLSNFAYWLGKEMKDGRL